MPRRPEGGSPPPEQKISLDQWISAELPKHYQSEVLFLRQAGLIEILPKSRDMGLLDITGKERPLPTPEAIATELREHKEIFTKKLNQGFTDFRLTPFGSPLAKLEALVRKALLKHHQDGKLFGTDYDVQKQPKPVKLDLDINQPLYVWDKLEKSDENGSIIYYPKQFTKNNHGGQTKQELLEQEAVFPGWNVLLTENTPVIPRGGNGRTIGSRKQLEAGASPNDYLKTFLSNPTYVHESGQTPEDELTALLQRLAKDNQVLHDFGNNVDSLNYLTGAWVPASGDVPDGYWNRDGRRAYLLGSDPTFVSGNYGVAPAVRMGLLKI